MFILTLVEESEDGRICVVRMETDMSPYSPHNCGLLYMSKHEWTALACLLVLGGRQSSTPVDVTITDYLYNRRIQEKENGEERYDPTQLQGNYLESHRDSHDGQRESKMAVVATARSLEGTQT